MKLRNITIIGIIFIFLFSFITHNIYNWFPNIITSIFFPVNESIWEHFKMIFLTTLIWGVIEYFLLKRFCIPACNIIITTVASAIINIILIFFIYIPINEIWEDNIFLTLIIYLLTITITQLISEYFLLFPNFPSYSNIVAIALIPLMFIIFGILTYKTPHNEELFYDEVNSKYGVSHYYDNSDTNEKDDDEDDEDYD